MKIRVKVPGFPGVSWLGKPVSPGTGPAEETSVSPETPPPSGGDRYIELNPRRSPWIAAGLVVALLASFEFKTAWAQSRILSYAARAMHYDVRPGANPEIQYPQAGPYDARLGHARLPQFQARLERAGFEMIAQARSSKLYRYLAGLTRAPIYKEKNQAGLRILDYTGQPLYSTQFPQRIYRDYDAIPPIVVNSLLYVENREILDPDTPYRNPAVEWDRLAKAMLDLGIRQVHSGHAVSGGSTLATQLEKVRHSPGGRTESVTEKFRQMLSASLRAYQDGEETIGARKQIICDYINSVPLSSLAGYGEVHGLGDALYAWYGSDFDRTNRVLAVPGDSNIEEKALAYRQVLTLLLAIRKPSSYLQEAPELLDGRLTAYLPLLVDAGIISTDMREAVLRSRSLLRNRYSGAPPAAFAERKTADSLRGSLLTLLGIGSTYDLDRLDLTAHTHLDGHASQQAAAKLRELATPEGAAAGGLLGEQMVEMNRADQVIYSFTLYERRSDANLLRIQVDNYKEALNLNEGSRLELGSTAKLRTLVSYLEVVSWLHEELHTKTRSELEALRVHPQDTLRKFAVEHLMESVDPSLTVMLEASMNRVIAAWSDTFYTGGGVQVFSNFDDRDGGRRMTLREAFFRSVNLPFVRIMREVVHYHIYKNPHAASVLDDPRHPEREKLLRRFADNEGAFFLSRYFKKYNGLNTDQVLDNFLTDSRMNPRRLAVIYRLLKPRATELELIVYLESSPVARGIDSREVEKLYAKYGPNRYDLNDLSYLANVHPLELWLLEYLRDNPKASWEQVSEASKEMRQFVYQWLVKRDKTFAQNMRIKTLMEKEAFQEIHKSWKKMGYPFPSLVPSYGTALGSSGDTPAALAELVGIILNDGVRLPTIRIDRLHFAQRTPVESVMARKSREGERVLPVEVAAVVRDAMSGVVERGTAARAWHSVTLANGTAVAIGGKTGTGDNRRERHDRHGWLVGSKVVNRTAAFVFYIGDRFFGTVTAYVPGEDAAGQRFTSALPVTVFRNLVPSFRDLVINTVPVPGPQLAKSGTAKALN